MEFKFDIAKYNNSELIRTVILPERMEWVKAAFIMFSDKPALINKIENMVYKTTDSLLKEQFFKSRHFVQVNTIATMEELERFKLEGCKDFHSSVALIHPNISNYKSITRVSNNCLIVPVEYPLNIYNIKRTEEELIKLQDELNNLSSTSKAHLNRILNSISRMDSPMREKVLHQLLPEYNSLDQRKSINSIVF